MKTSFQKLQMMIILLEHKWALLTKNFYAQQLAIEKMLVMQTEMRIEKEQYINKILFK